MSVKKLYLIDGTSLSYRSHFAVSLTNSSGFSTGAVYGFYRTLRKIILEEKPDFIAVCFDISRKTYRREKYKDYKIQRPDLPDELKAQFPVIKRLAEALGIKIVEKKGFEADDVIASLCKKARSQGLEVVIVGSDKDFFQLLSDEGVAVYNYKEQKCYRQDDFIKKYGFKPCYMIDFLSLAGDSSDNIPGAKGIGRVGASGLIKQYGGIDAIFKNLDKMKPKMAEKIKESREDIFLSRELVELSTPKLNVEIKKLKKNRLDKKELADIFSQLEFKLPRDELFNQAVPQIKIEKGLNPAGFKSKQLIYFIEKGKIYIYLPEKESVYIEAVESFQGILSETMVEKISFNLKKQNLISSELKVEGKSFDVKIASYLVDSSISDYSLASLVALFLEEQYSEIRIELYPYFIWKLHKVLAKRLKEYSLDSLFYNVEMPLVKVLSQMESCGINIDTEQLKKVLKKVSKKIEETKEAVFFTAGKKFNLNSPKQLQEVLFGDLGIKPLKKTKTGYSTNEEVLKELAAGQPIAEDILQYRELSKLKNTYLVPLSKKVESSGGKLFSFFSQTGTETGRLSSSSPNLQSIPTKGEFSFQLRKAFLSSYQNGFIVCGDYSQIELRILAHLSGDKNLITAFKNNSDIHQFTASLLFQTPESKVEDYQRNIAKKVNFGIVYGMSSYGLARELGINLNQAQEFIENYFKRYPEVQSYIKKTISLAERNGWVETILKRRRNLPQINSSNPQLRDFAKRQAVNAPIQGSCADIIKLAMVKIDKQIKKTNIKAKLIMQIHDELVFDVAEKSLDKLIYVMKSQMEKNFSLTVPLKVNIKAGKNWAEAESV